MPGFGFHANAFIRLALRNGAIDQKGPALNSIIEVNPDAETIAEALDKERQSKGPRGPLHGIPILLKDNIDTADRMMTTAGSLALVGPAPLQDSTMAAKLRAAGAVILGKTNMSEWANFRSFHSSSGWSGRGGQCRNPYILDRNPCGSSSGSAAAVSANLTAAALGSETDGSITCPAHANGVVGIKPTVGLTSRAGVIPISHSQDTLGPHARTVTDAAIVLGALTGIDSRDPATAASLGRSYTDYTPFLDASGLVGARIGVVRDGHTGYSEETDAVFEEALAKMAAAGAMLVDPADIPNQADQLASFAEFDVLLYEFKADLKAYLATRTGVPIHSLAEAIAFNQANADREMPFFLQEIFEFSETKGPLTETEYLDALAESNQLFRTDGIDKVMSDLSLDALVAPVGTPAWTTDVINGDHFVGGGNMGTGGAGYPDVVVPAGFSHGLPVGVQFVAGAWSEPTLIKLAYAFEQATQARQPPQFLATLDLNLPKDKPKPHKLKTTLKGAERSRPAPASSRLLGR